MPPIEEPHSTRFRAYQLGDAGSSYSYFTRGHFTLVEARLTDDNRNSILQEMAVCGVDQIDTLHISSWDQDHCSQTQLGEILVDLKPSRIEYPGYAPSTENGVNCLAAITTYKAKAVKIDPAYIAELSDAESLAYQDIFYGPKIIYDDPNDNSTMKLFRRGAFTVLSLGDVGHSDLSSRIRRAKVVKAEMDVLILPHHGANNGFLSNNLLKHIKPTFAVCCADHSNKFGHPKEEVRQLLSRRKIDLFTTKTGDVIVESFGKGHRQLRVTNLKAGSTEISSEKNYHSKRGGLFSRLNLDSLRNYRRGNKRNPQR
ncbi:MAG: ComEC/Rec2 family competence protein [Rhodospirillales bacterium]